MGWKHCKKTQYCFQPTFACNQLVLSTHCCFQQWHCTDTLLLSTPSGLVLSTHLCFQRTVAVLLRVTFKPLLLLISICFQPIDATVGRKQLSSSHYCCNLLLLSTTIAFNPPLLSAAFETQLISIYNCFSGFHLLLSITESAIAFTRFIAIVGWIYIGLNVRVLWKQQLIESNYG